MPEKVKEITVVAGLIFDGRRVLACQRHENGAFPLKWEFPGGKVKEGEAEAEALRREWAEELGIVARELRLVFQNRHRYPEGLAVSLSFFHVGSYDGAVKNLVFQQIEWVELTELERLDFLAGDQPLIRHLLTPTNSPLTAKYD
jgi:8-oxo-dGTP diphosphatase